MAGFLSLEKPVLEKKKLTPPPVRVLEPAVIKVVEKPVVPVQPVEERDDDLLFEADALSFMPFDQAITMPFD